MIKTMTLLARKDGLSPEEFKHQLQDVYAGVAKTIPGVRGFIVHEIVKTMTRPDIPVLTIGADIDALLELWVDNEAAYQALLATPAMQSWLASGTKFIGRSKIFLAQEDTLIPVPNPRPAIKTVAFLCRKPGEDIKVFRHHWHDGHGGMARVVPYLRGFILNDVIGVQDRNDIPAIPFDAVDGFAEGWLDSPEAQQAMIATPQAKGWFADGSQTFGQIKSFLTREIVIVPPPGA